MRYIDRWMLLLLAVLLIACQGSDEDNNSSEDCYLDIHVYAPDRPIVTRGDVGNVTSVEAEKKVHSLQIWVFKRNGGDKVGYLGVDATSGTNADLAYLNQTGQQTYRMKVAKDFADHPEAVDVYVVANAASCGLTFIENTTRSDLDAAQIGENYFGTNTLVSTVGDNGLPMSAVEKNQPIYGTFPSLRIGKENEMTTLKLTRAVSKLRFVLCRKDDSGSSKKLDKINSITLEKNQIPDETWLIAREVCNYTQRNHDAINYGEVEKNAIPLVEDPLIYAYETQTAQEYEDLINSAVQSTVQGKHLMQLGLTYLRESDLQLKGKITYTYKDGETLKTVDTEFSMAAPGDFLRNHSWIIYIFYMDTKIHVQMVTDIGMRSWIPDGRDESVIVYNW